MNSIGRLFFVIFSTVIKDTHQIYGGWKAEPKLFPHQVAIYMVATFSCGGSIIDESHILTAAHCVDEAPNPYLVRVLAGIEILDDPNRVSRHVKRIYIHPDFRRPGAQHDIAVLTLDSPYTDRDGIATIRLTDSDGPYCEECYFAGWGRATKQSPYQTDLLWTALTILPFEVCRDEFGLPHHPYELRTISELHSSTTSAGDSGGALICNGEAVGVLSGGARDSDLPDLFNKVYSHLPFIHAVTSEWTHPINVSGE